jgi:SRSO17 transposase
LLSDSKRKSMEAMLARVTEPGSYQAFQHFITDAPWSADRVWQRLRAVLPEREGLLIIDGTSFPKQGTHSVGVGRQYCGTLGKVANCQVAVTAALWTGVRGYLLGAALYLPEAWLTETARARARIPTSVRFQAKWRQALTLLRQARTSGLTITGVLADAEFGDNGQFRAQLHRLGLPYAVGVSSSQTVFLGRPTLVSPPRGGTGRPRTRPTLPAGVTSATVAAVAAAQLRWRRITWRNRGAARAWAVECVAVRVTPAHDWRERRRLAPEVWLLAERDTGATPQTKYAFVHLPATASRTRLVRFAHQRWAIEQQYRELKTDLGLDHFEGRTFPGWHHHVVLTAITYNFLQAERRRRLAGLTFPQARAIVQEIFTALLFAQKPHYLKRIEALRSVKMQI